MADLRKDLSLIFYNYICTVVGSEEVVATRRNIFASLDNVQSDGILVRFSSGSKAEGLDLEGSDYDRMMINNYFQVYENSFDIETESRGIPLLIDTSNTKPPFTLLKFHSAMDLNAVILNRFSGVDREKYVNFDMVRYWSEMYDGKLVLSSKLVRERTCRSKEGAFEHGPCAAFQFDLYDHVICYQSKKWISLASKWMFRSKMNWPRNDVIRSIVRVGVLFVPIGNKNSPNQNIQWRISFSHAELKLIHSFNHVQLLCYALMKIILTDTLKPEHEELLCSYFMKTIMFFVCEETASETWRPDNILSCFMSCLKRLSYCVEYQICLHYFIPDCNMFANRFDRHEQKKLLCTLHRLTHVGWACLLQTKTLKGFHGALQRPLQTTEPAASHLPCVFYNHFNESHSGKKSLFNCIKIYTKTNSDSRHFYLYQLSRINLVIGQTIDNEHIADNKQNYKSYNRCLCHLLIGTNHDAISGWLMDASLFYTRKQYRLCNTVTRFTLSEFDYRQIVVPQRLLHPRWLRVYGKCTEGMGRKKFLTTCKRYTADFVIFTETSSVRLPEMACSEEEDAFYPFVYAPFLNCLCSHRLGNETEKMKSYCYLLLQVQYLSEDYNLFEDTRDRILKCIGIAGATLKSHNIAK